jgi:hypothetical protein
MTKKRLMTAVGALALALSANAFADQKHNDGRGADDAGKPAQVGDDNQPKHNGEGKGHPVRRADDNQPKHSGEGKGHPVHLA